MGTPPKNNKAGLLTEKVENSLHSYFRRAKVPYQRSEDEAWKLLVSSIRSDSEKKSSRVVNLFPYKVWAAAAAIILMLLTSTWMTGLYRSKVICGHGERLMVWLPDSSSVMLNAGSTIQFSKLTWWHNRRVWLNGEGYFEVKGGKPFRVLTTNGEIRVLGTSFNVYARNSELRVWCHTGKVMVRTENDVVLTPGKITGSDGGNSLSAPRLSEPHMTIGWQTGQFWFDNELLDRVFREIERQFNVTLEFENSSNRHYTGYFSGDSLSQALELVCQPMQLTYKINANKISVYNK